MKKWKSLILAMVLFLNMICSTMPVFAQDEYFSGDYVYTIRISTGAQGTIFGGMKELVIKSKPGAVLDLRFFVNSVKMNTTTDASGSVVENKYYAKGLRESGKDNNTVAKDVATVIKVDRDIDLVIAYGMKGSDCRYYVKYVNEETGETLAPTQTFYGNVGEKPVVAFQYIAGYIPQAYNLTRTLKEDAEEGSSQNIFVFTYRPSTMNEYHYFEGDTQHIYLGTNSYEDTSYQPGEEIYIDDHRNGNTPSIALPSNGNHDENLEQELDQNWDNVDHPDHGDAQDYRLDDYAQDSASDAEVIDEPEIIIDLDEVPLSQGVPKKEQSKHFSELSVTQKIEVVVLLLAIVLEIGYLIRKGILAKKQERQKTNENP